MTMTFKSLLLFACSNLLFLGLNCHCHAFVVQQPNLERVSPVLFSSQTEDNDSSFLDGIQQDLTMRWRIYQESQSQGYNFKQTMANVLAGEYDQDAIKEKINTLVQSSPCVMFTWERSPSCVQAKKAMEIMGILDQIKEVPLDKPWDEGNPLRAELGKQVGRSSVPAIFIGGKYVGGFDGGISDEAPGIQAMAFKGTLRPALEAAGIEFPKQ